MVDFHLPPRLSGVGLFTWFRRGRFWWQICCVQGRRSIRCARQRSEIPSKDQNDYPQDFLVSESTRYVGRAVVALAVDPKVKKKI